MRVAAFPAGKVHVVAGSCRCPARRQGAGHPVLVGVQRLGMAGAPDDRESRDRRRLSVWRAADYFRIMLKRRIMLPPEHLYPADEWRIVEARYSDQLRRPDRGTVLSLGNGFLGVRGSFEEGRPGAGSGTLSTSSTADLADRACGRRARAGQDRPDDCGCSDVTIIKLYVDDEALSLRLLLQDHGPGPAQCGPGR